MASVTKRSWAYKSVTHEAWAVRYVDGKGRRRSRQFDLKKDALAYKREVERETYFGTHVAHADTVTVKQAIELFLEHSEQRQRDGRIGRSRLTSLRTSLTKHVVPEIGGIRFRELSIAQVEGVYRAMMRNGAGAWHAKSVIGELKLVEIFGHRRGFTKSTSVAFALADLRGIRPNKVNAPSIELATKLLRASLAFRPGIRMRSAEMVACFVHLAACCGLRMGEIMGLSVENVDLVSGEVRVRQNITAYREIKGPKTKAGNRDVPLPPHLVEMLRRWMARHFVPNPDGLVFVNPRGKSPSHSDMHQRWRTLLRETEALDAADPLHFHSLRHFAGSWWLHQGVRIGDASKMLGHANPGITMKVYAHGLSTDGERREQIRSAGALLMPPLPQEDDARVRIEA